MTTPTTHTPPDELLTAAHPLYGLAWYDRPQEVSMPHLIVAVGFTRQPGDICDLEVKRKIHCMSSLTNYTDYRLVMCPQATPQEWIDLPEVLVTCTVDRDYVQRSVRRCIDSQIVVTGADQHAFENILFWSQQDTGFGSGSLRVRLAVVRGQQ